MGLYLVTGGCGFIGSHLADALLAQGHAVRVLDDLSTGKRENLDPRVGVTVGDVADPALVAQAMDGADGDDSSSFDKMFPGAARIGSI